MRVKKLRWQKSVDIVKEERRMEPISNLSQFVLSVGVIDLNLENKRRFQNT